MKPPRAEPPKLFLGGTILGDPDSLASPLGPAIARPDFIVFRGEREGRDVGVGAPDGRAVGTGIALDDVRDPEEARGAADGVGPRLGVSPA